MRRCPHVLVSVALGLTLALPGATGSHAASSPSPSLPPVDFSMGRAPGNCQASAPAMTHAVYNTKPNVVPHRYWWVGRGRFAGYSGWVVRGRHVILHFGVRTRYGYPQKVFWQLMHGTPDPVTLRGWNVRTGRPIWFGHPLPVAHPQPMAPPPVIAWPVGVVRPHRAPTLIFVPAAGCYLLEARWSTGSWILPFAAGCLDDPRVVAVARCKPKG